MRTVINTAIFEYGKLLLVRKGDVYILPGGKLNEGESDEECLRREIREELSGTEIRGLQFYREFRGISPHKKQPIISKVYFADIYGRLGDASCEIESFTWVPFIHIPNYNLSDITKDIADSLNKDGRFDRILCK